MWYVFSYILSFCEREKQIEFDPETVEVLRAIYKETDPDNTSEDEIVEETDSQDSDFEPEEDVDEESSEEEESDDEEVSEDVAEEIIIKKDKNGHYYIY